jgi:hypothetical protein
MVLYSPANVQVEMVTIWPPVVGAVVVPNDVLLRHCELILFETNPVSRSKNIILCILNFFISIFLRLKIDD